MRNIQVLGFGAAYVRDLMASGLCINVYLYLVGCSTVYLYCITIVIVFVFETLKKKCIFVFVFDKTYLTPGARPTTCNDISIKFEIQSKLGAL